jgi:predicted phosphate transport protein (TIGR00153 family)
LEGLSKKIFAWFAPKRGEEVLDMAEKHLELTRSAVIDLYNMVDAAARCDAEGCASYYMSLSKMEMEADELRRKMINALTVSEMFPEERDDLMELVRAIDWIADWSKEAGRILEIIHLDRAPEEIRDAALSMVKADGVCVGVLTECLKMMSTDSKEAINFANKVEMLEEDIDELYSIARRHLASLDFPDWTVGSIILLNEFLDALETIADWCENTADIVRAIAVRMR